MLNTQLVVSYMSDLGSCPENCCGASKVANAEHITRNERERKREVNYPNIHMDTYSNAILFIDTPPIHKTTIPIRHHVSRSFLVMHNFW